MQTFKATARSVRLLSVCSPPACRLQFPGMSQDRKPVFPKSSKKNWSWSLYCMLFRFQTKLFANMFELRIFFCSEGCTVMKINITRSYICSCCLGTETDDTRTRKWLVHLSQSSKQSSKSGYNDLGGTFTQALYDLLCQGRLNLFDKFRASF